MNRLDMDRGFRELAQAIESHGKLAASHKGLGVKNPWSFRVHPDAFYGPYDVAYLGDKFAETIVETEQIKAVLLHRRKAVTVKKKKEDPYRLVRDTLRKLPGFLRPLDKSEGLLVQGWILLRFQLLPPLTAGQKGWIISPEDATKLLAEKAAPTKATPRKTEPSDKYKRGVEERTAAVRQQNKSSPLNHR